MTSHPSVLTPPPYKNKQEYKCGTNDKTYYSHTRDTSVSRRDDDSLAISLNVENKNIEYDEYNDHASIKKIKLIHNHMKIRKRLFFFIKSNRFGFV